MKRTFEECARDLVEAGHILYEQGMVPATSGNFSARIGDERIAITVSGRPSTLDWPKYPCGERITTLKIMGIPPKNFSSDPRICII